MVFSSVSMAQSMAQSAEEIYDRFLLELKRILGKVDPHLAVRIMYLEREFAEVYPSVSLKIKYKERANLDKKRYDLNSRYGFLISSEGHGVLRATGRMNIKTIEELSSDPHVESMNGSTTPASY